MGLLLKFFQLGDLREQFPYLIRQIGKKPGICFGIDRLAITQPLDEVVGKAIE